MSHLLSKWNLQIWSYVVCFVGLGRIVQYSIAPGAHRANTPPNRHVEIVFVIWCHESIGIPRCIAFDDDLDLAFRGDVVKI